MKCQYCSKECKNDNAHRNHERLCRSNPSFISNTIHLRNMHQNSERWKSNHKASNHFLKAKSEGRVCIVSEETKRKCSKSHTGKLCSPEHRNKISSSMRKAVLKYPDSFSASNVSGRVKTFSFSGTKVKGKWELLIALKLNLYGIKWTNKIEPFDYVWRNKTHLYFPDFYLPEFDLYIEVKGFKTDRDIAKWQVMSGKRFLVLECKEIHSIRKDDRIIFDLIGD